jgi:hypothetical protein
MGIRLAVIKSWDLQKGSTELTFTKNFEKGGVKHLQYTAVMLQYKA